MLTKKFRVQRPFLCSKGERNPGDYIYLGDIPDRVLENLMNRQFIVPVHEKEDDDDELRDGNGNPKARKGKGKPRPHAKPRKHN